MGFGLKLLFRKGEFYVETRMITNLGNPHVGIKVFRVPVLGSD